MSDISENIILIEDYNDEKIDDNCTVISWYDNDNINLNKINAISLTTYLEDNAKYIRDLYFSKLNNFFSLKINSKKISDYFKINNNFNTWWMSLNVENSNFAKNPEINDMLRFVALEEIIKNANVKEIKFIGNNDEISSAVKKFCKNKKINFSNFYKIKNKFFLNFIIFLKNYIYGFLYLFVYSFKRLPLVLFQKNLRNKRLKDIMFVSYFLNIEIDQQNKGKVKNNYWPNIDKILKKNNYHSTWYYIFIPSKKIPNSIDALKKINYLNNNNLNKDNHVIIDGYINLPIIIKTLYQWFRINLKLIFIYKKIFNNMSAKEPFILLLKKSFTNYWFGPGSILNLLYFNLFKRICNNSFKIAIYLMENQGWERALNFNWKTKCNNKIIGVPHTAIGFWDLRFFNKIEKYQILEPDIIAVNGNHSFNLLKTNPNYKKLILNNVEALRYANLQKIKPIIKTNRKIPNVVIVADVVAHETINMLDLIKKVSERYELNINYIFKPHPGSTVNINKYRNLNIEVTDKKIIDILKDTDIAFTSSMTSGAVEFYLAGIKVISLITMKNVNFSPLRDYKNVSFIRNSKDYVDAINNHNPKIMKPVSVNNFFNFDTNLNRWDKLIKKYID